MDNPGIILGTAFILGYVAKLIHLPPLVGFLAAGFILRATLGYEFTAEIGELADLGVTLMLFTIGLKLKVKDLMQKPVWAGSTAHLLTTVAIFTPLLLLGGMAGMPYLSDLTLGSAATVAFALAFSSTVFAVVMFQQAGTNDASHAKLAIGVLIMQDIFAVMYLTASKGVMPSWGAIPLLLGLWPLRYILLKLLNKSGHGELLLMLGLLVPLGIAGAFEAVKLKGDLGALIIGMLLAASPKSSELSKMLFSFKELFLVMFFVSIGLRGDPSWAIVAISGLLILVMPIKTILFYLYFSLLRVRTRPATFATLSLSNYSEFGLIVGALAASSGIIANEWLLVFAIALSISYVIAAPASQRSQDIYDKLLPKIARFESKQRLTMDMPIPLVDAKYLVVGMTAIGKSICESLSDSCGNDRHVRAIDYKSTNDYTIAGDATDGELWERIDLSSIETIFIALPSQEDDSRPLIIELIRGQGFSGEIIVSTEYKDEIPAMLAAGATKAHSIAAEAGRHLASLAHNA